jgi:hypothetical protein
VRLTITMAVVFTGLLVLREAYAHLVPPATRPADASATPKQSTFCCNRAALSPEARKRHFEVLGPGLRKACKQTHELPDGFEFEFSPDGATMQLVSEWAAGERVCCPFLHIALRHERDNSSVWLRLTGARE